MKRSRLMLGVGVIVASGAFGLSAFQNSLVSSVTFRQAEGSDRSVQVYGDVKKEQVRFDARTGTLTFPMKDHEGTVVTVVSRNGKPSNFDQTPKVVAIGRMGDGVFEAEKLLTKCPSKYEAEPGGHPDGVKVR